MGEMNGNSFELGRVVGHLQATMDHNTDMVALVYDLNIQQLDTNQRVLSTLEGMRDDLRERIPDARATPMLNQVSEFIRTAWPPVLILVALVVKLISPEHFPVVRDLAAAAFVRG